MKDKKFLFASVLVAVFLLSVGLTYAYFSLTISGNDVAETINVDTTKLELKYTDGKEVKATNIEPGWTITKTITVENTGNEEAYYTLGWQKLYNELQKEELVIRSVCTSGGVLDGTCDNTDNVVVPQTSEVTAESNKVLYPYKEAALILPGETHTYTVTIEFINYTNKPQNYNQGKSFYGVLGLVEAYNKYSLTLNIKNIDGNPLANKEVTLHSTPMSGTTNENGTVVFNNVELGNHTLSVIDNDITITTNIGITGGKNDVVKIDDRYKIKPKNENIKLDVVVDNTKINDISLSTFAKYLTDHYQSLGLTKIDQTATGNQNYDTTEYRYQGKTPNNYITFNGEENKWRIIGVFEVETPNGDGTYKKESKVKLVREQLGNVPWEDRDNSNVDDWTTIPLITLLNQGPYYNRTTGDTELMCGIKYDGMTNVSSICDYTSIGLTNSSKNQISTTKWYLGDVPVTIDILGDGGLIYGTSKEIYRDERKAGANDENKLIWNLKVGLIYPSDYMYASSNCYNNGTLGSNYENNECKETNWLLDSNNWYWTLSTGSSFTGYRTYVFNNGDLGFDDMAYRSGGVRPSLYLNSDITYTSGSGTLSDPFVIN